MIVYAIPFAIGLTLQAQSKAAFLGAAAMGVVPFHKYERCLDKSSVHRKPDGLTYFNIVACGLNMPHLVEEYRLNCRQDRDGPWAYEHKIDNLWISISAKPSDEIGQIIVQVCAFPKGLPKKPPEPSF